MEQGRWGRVLLVALDLVLGCRLVVEGFCDMDSYFLVMFRFRVPVSVPLAFLHSASYCLVLALLHRSLLHSSVP